ncbi:hypothetical protein MVEN_02116100 [Mycena venus]|uniref:Uncharacterized protein n=1 Tax=Mycena venus TaxID=2733690 RepID=A0A8H6X982_9AGAR|nr:hypothetical protein MVEN_02116100 [Mycena venus]
MFSTSTFISLTLIAATAAPGLCAPVPAARDVSISSRSLASIIEGLLGGLFPEGEQVVEGLVGNLLERGSSTDATASAPVAERALSGSVATKVIGGAAGLAGSLFGGEIPDILEKLFNRRAFTDLSDDEVNTLLEYINNNVDKRELNARLALPKGALSGIIKKLAGSALTSGAVAGLEKLLGGDSDADATAADPATTDAPASRRALASRSLASIIEGLLGGLFPGEQVVEGLIGNLLGGGAGSSGSEANATTTSPAATPIARAVSRSAATKVIGGAAGEIPDILEKWFNRRAFTDLSDDEVNTLLEYINNNVDKRELNARLALPKGALSGIIKKLAGSALTSGAFAGLEKLLGGDSDPAADPATTDAPVSRRAFTDLSDDEVNSLFEWINKISSAPGGGLNDLD